MKTFFSKHRLFYCNNDIKQSTVAMVNCVIRINKFVGNHHTMEYQASKCAKVNDLCKASLVFFIASLVKLCVEGPISMNCNSSSISVDIDINSQYIFVIGSHQVSIRLLL